MDGAVEAGERCAEEIASALGIKPGETPTPVESFVVRWTNYETSLKKHDYKRTMTRLFFYLCTLVTILALYFA